MAKDKSRHLEDKITALKIEKAPLKKLEVRLLRALDRHLLLNCALDCRGSGASLEDMDGKRSRRRLSAQGISSAEIYLAKHTTRLKGLEIPPANGKIIAVNETLSQMNRGPV